MEGLEVQTLIILYIRKKNRRQKKKEKSHTTKRGKAEAGKKKEKRDSFYTSIRTPLVLLLAADKEQLPINPSHINKSMQVQVEVRWITNWRTTATSQLQAAPTPQSVAAASSSSWSSSARRLFVRSSFVAWTDSSESVMQSVTSQLNVIVECFSMG